ncbi:MAG: hypothetical protein WCF14_01945 [Nitrososphaeraceae archaeon]
MERIERCELIENLMWTNYHCEKDSTNKVRILAEIINMQPYLSSYYEDTGFVLEQSASSTFQLENKLENVDIDVAIDIDPDRPWV